MGAGYGVRVLRFRERHNFSRNLLANMTQVSPGVIARVENGEVTPSEDWWNKFLMLERQMSGKKNRDSN